MNKIISNVTNIIITIGVDTIIHIDTVERGTHF